MSPPACSGTSNTDSSGHVSAAGPSMTPAQPWKKWFPAGSLDTDKAGENDHEPSIPISQTQAVTNLG